MTAPDVTIAPADPFGSPAKPKPPLLVRGRYNVPEYNPDAPDGIKRDASGEPITRSYQRVTNFCKVVADEEALTKWKMRNVARGIAVREDLRMRAASADWPLATWLEKKDMNDIAYQASEAAAASHGANMGTALHSFMEQYKAGRAVAIPEAWAPKVRAYQEALTAHGLTPYMQEKIVVNLKLGVVGRFDDIFRDEATGELIIGDTKTSADLYTFDTFAVQFSAYQDADLIFDYDAYTLTPMPKTNPDVAVLVWLPLKHPDAPDGHRCDIINVPLTRAREFAARLCQDVMEWRREAKSLGYPRPLPGLSREQSWLVRLQNAAGQQELSAVWQEANAAGGWTDELQAAGMARLAQLQAGGAA